MNCATETEKPKIVRVVNVSDKKEVLYVCTTLLFLLVEHGTGQSNALL